jgi:hypothetical protein
VVACRRVEPTTLRLLPAAVFARIDFSRPAHYSSLVEKFPAGVVIPAPASKRVMSLPANPRHHPFNKDGAGGFVEDPAILHPLHNENVMQPDRKTLLLAQVLITFMMAASMSGIMSFIALGPSALWLRVWPSQFLIAWPIAFVLTLFVSKFAFSLAGTIMGRVRAR